MDKILTDINAFGRYVTQLAIYSVKMNIRLSIKKF